MLQITYTNGDVQNVNVTGDFFTITLVPKNGKKIELAPMEKAEGMAIDLAQGSRKVVHSIAVFFDLDSAPKMKYYYPLIEREPREEKVTESAAFRKHKKTFRGKSWKQRWVWTF